jgi:hypothetical protein
MTTIEQAGGKLRNAITSAKSKGWAIVRYHVRGASNAKPACCVIGALVIDLPGGVPLNTEVARRLNISLNETVAIARGFDGSPYDPDISTPDWHALGERLYSELKEGTL